MLVGRALSVLCVLLLSSLAGQGAEPIARPILVLDPDMHVAAITSLSVDASGETAATASLDGTVRLWDTQTGRLIRTLRLPRGPDNIGKAFALALSPDGRFLAVGGWLRWSDADPQEQIYIYDLTDAQPATVIGGLPNVTFSLAFSPDGRSMAAALGASSGMRLYRQGPEGWDEIASDDSATARSNAVAFAGDGRLAASSSDGTVRLYDSDGLLLAKREFLAHKPVGLAYSEDGARLAVGLADGDGVTLLDGANLSILAELRDDPAAVGEFSVVTWSGDRLYAAGTRRVEKTAQVIGWQGSAPLPSRLDAASNTIYGLAALPGGDLIVASAEPLLQRISPDGAVIWSNAVPQMDPRDQHGSLAVSADGMIVDFEMHEGGRRLRFDLDRLQSEADPQADDVTRRPDQDGLDLVGWNDGQTPQLEGRMLPLDPEETARSVAISESGRAFVLGTDWNLRAFDAVGRPLWIRAGPSAAWAVNITADERLAVAAYGDGTIRWHRMEDGAEILALYLLEDGTDWVVWTPEGVYAASRAARAVLRWHVNRGWSAPAEAIPVHQIPQTLRPTVIPHVLPQLGTPGALAVAELAEIREAVQDATGAAASPGARLHILAIGVGHYNDETAANLDLDYADNDADDFARALYQSQSGLYSEVRAMRLLDQTATRAGILRALAATRDAMLAGDGSDLAVIHFSGHGALVDDVFYLLPFDVDARDPVSISGTALDAIQLQREVARMARNGRVIVLLDACRSGASTGGGVTLAADGDRLRSLMQGPNISVLTSSSADQDSIEDAAWENGAFTEILLESISSHRADIDNNGILTMSEMTAYISRRVPQITKGQQIPSIELRFESAVFAVGD